MSGARRGWLAFGALAVTLAACVVMLVRQQRQIDALRSELDESRMRDAVLRGSLESERERGDRLEQELADTVGKAQERVAVAAGPPAPRSAAGNAEPPRPNRFGGPRGNPMENPDFQKGYISQMRAGLDQRYPSLFRKLNLTPDELKHLKDLLVDRQAGGLDARTAGVMNGITDPAEIQAFVEQAQAGIDAEIKSFRPSSRRRRECSTR
jgi:hypothetical protein